MLARLVNFIAKCKLSEFAIGVCHSKKMYCDRTNVRSKLLLPNLVGHCPMSDSNLQPCCYGNMICFPSPRRIKFPKNQELQKRFVSQAQYFFVAVCCFLICPTLENMVRKQCFLVRPPLESMARKQCFLVCLPLGAMARKHCQCFLVCALWANVAMRK